MTSVGTEWKRAGQIQQELSCFSAFFQKVCIGIGPVFVSSLLKEEWICIKYRVDQFLSLR